MKSESQLERPYLGSFLVVFLDNYLIYFFLSTIFITCVGLGRNFKYKTVSLIVYSLLQGICVLIWVWYILKNVKLTTKMYWITWNENCSPFFLGENKTPWFWYYRVWNWYLWRGKQSVQFASTLFFLMIHLFFSAALKLSITYWSCFTFWPDDGKVEIQVFPIRRHQPLSS